MANERAEANFLYNLAVAIICKYFSNLFELLLTKLEPDNYRLDSLMKF